MEINWKNIKYNLFYHYTKKEIKQIYQFLKMVEKRAKKYNKRKDLKVKENISLVIRDTSVYVHIVNTEDTMKVDDNIGEIEIAIGLMKSMTPYKIGLNDSITFRSNQNYYGGLSLIDFNEYLKVFKYCVQNYDETVHKEEES